MTILLTAFAFVRDSWAGKLIAALIGILLLRAFWKGQGASEAKEYIARASTEAALEREKVREDIDNDIAARSDAVKRLSDNWSRD